MRTVCTAHCTCDELKLKKTNISHECNKYFFLIQTNKFGNCFKYNMELLQIHFAIRRCISSGELEANTRPLQNRRLGLRNVFSGFACEILFQEYFRPLRQLTILLDICGYMAHRLYSHINLAFKCNLETSLKKIHEENFRVQSFLQKHSVFCRFPCPSAKKGGPRRKVWTQTKILSPNICYFVAN